MKCDKCGGDYGSVKCEKNKTYWGIDVHHNPPQYMFAKGAWKGDLICLCRKCHKDFHFLILVEMRKHSNLLKPNNSEEWTWKSVFGQPRFDCIEEVRKLKEVWLNEYPKQT